MAQRPFPARHFPGLTGGNAAFKNSTHIHESLRFSLPPVRVLQVGAQRGQRGQLPPLDLPPAAPGTLSAPIHDRGQIYLLSIIDLHHLPPLPPLPPVLFRNAKARRAVGGMQKSDGSAVETVG